MSSYLKQLVKPLIPRVVLNVRRRMLNRGHDKVFFDKTPEEAFTRIYRTSQWGSTKGQEFYSGPGSHDDALVTGYVDSVARFLTDHNRQLDGVDLGCGDFNVGSRLRQFCNRYTACDVVADLIAHNRSKFKDLDVEFRQIDITRDALPDGDVVFLRQVLQHLSNDQIQRVLPKLEVAGYRYMVLTEGLPTDPNFQPNIDKPIGPGVRMARDTPDSGVVLTAAPFNLAVKSEQIIWEINDPAGLVRTTVYQLK